MTKLSEKTTATIFFENMDSSDLMLNIHFLGSSGIILSPEQKAALQTSLVILQHENNFDKIYFWGEIKGIRASYMIAQGIGSDEFGADRKYFYCMDYVTWVLMPDVSNDIITDAQQIKGRFTGDPSHEFKLPDQDEVDPEKPKHVKEEDRLAAIVIEIGHDAWIVPRGAFIRTPTGKVVPNQSYTGLSVKDSAKLYSYMHFEPATVLPYKSVIERASVDKSIDFMDTIESDIPKGCWSFQFERGCNQVTLRSLLWPGYVFYLLPETRKFGSLYVGIGEKNTDLPFML